MNAPIDIQTIAHADLPENDYVSPGLAIVMPDAAFPNMIVGDTSVPRWPYLRRWVGHNWYADRRNPDAGFVDRDEAALLYNNALLFRGKPCLEVGCWRGWSTVHLALGAGMLDVIDPILGNPDFATSVTASCEAAGVLDKITFHAEESPDAIHRLAQASGKRWSLIFIDAEHEGEAPRHDAEAAMPYAADTAMVLFHDLASPFVAAGLDAMRNAGWRTMIYQTMQIVGVAWRGDVQPVAHVPDPKIFWTLPRHLAGYDVSGWKPPAASTAAGRTMESQRNAAMLRAQAAEDDRVAAEAQQGEAKALARAAQVALAARQTERDAALAERDRIRAEQTVVVAQRDQAIAERDAALTSLNLVQSHRDAAATERDQAVVQRDLAVALRDQAVAQRDAVWEHRNDAMRQRDAATARADAAEAAVGRLGEQLLEIRATLVRLDEAEAKNLLAARQDVAVRRLAHWVLQRGVLLELLKRDPLQRIATIRARAASLGIGDATPDAFVHWLGRRRTLLGLFRRPKWQGEAAVCDGFRAAIADLAATAEPTSAGVAAWLGHWFAAARLVQPANMPRRGPAMARYFEALGFSTSGAHAWVTLLTADRSPAARRGLVGAVAGELAGNVDLASLAARIRNSPNFDEAFYRVSAGLDDAEADAALHYLLVGEPLGLPPSAAFDAAHYARRYGDIIEAGANSLLHYDAAGRGEGRQPLPAGAAPAQLSGPVAGDVAATTATLAKWLADLRARGTVVHKPTLPRPLLVRYAQGLGFGPSFAETWAALLAGEGVADPQPEVLDTIGKGLQANAELAEFAARVQRSAMFDEAFYRGRAGLNDADLDPALHYLLLGEPLGFAPSAVFDCAYYARRYADVVEQGVNCLLHYETTGRGEGRQALPATEARGQPAQDGKPLPAVAALEQWLSSGPAQVAARRRLAVSAPRLRQYFKRLGFSADGAAAWVAALTEASAPDTLNGLLGTIAKTVHDNSDLSTLAERVRHSRAFDEAFYREAAGIGSAEVDTALHYLLLGEPLGFAPSRAFDPHYYACRNDDIFNAGVNCLLHYDAAGRSEGRQPLPPSFIHANPALRDPARENIVVVVHEASRTGSPILGWNILRLLAQTYNVYTIALEEGPLTPEFLAFSVELHGPFAGANRHPVDMEFGLRPLFAGRTFKYAIVNSIESRRLVEVCARRSVSTLLLMHEFGSYVRPLESLRRALDLATEIVFPAPIVARSTTEAHPPLLDRPVRIHPQGMSVIPSSNTAKKKPPPARQMATLLQARAKGAFIVVGAGSVIIRKGVDLFISVAADVQRLELERPVFFLWVGHGYQPEKDMSYSIYLREQVERSGLHDRVMFMGEVSDLDPIYALADAFLLTSRLDPLPNVSIDAASRSIPTICFKDASGIADLLLSDPETAVGVVAHLDTEAAAGLIGRLAADEAARRRMAEATGRLAGTLFDMQTYVAKLDALGRASGDSTAHVRADAETLRADDSFDHGLFLGRDWPAIGRDEAIAQYLAVAEARRLGAPNASAAPLRRPMPGFHPWIWTAAHPPSIANRYADPLADFVRQGRPTGPWLLPVLRPTTNASSPAFELRALLHAHLGDLRLAEDLLADLRANTLACDLLVTTDDGEKAAALRQAVTGYDRGSVTISVISSRDGDGLRSIFAHLADACMNYDVIGHVHDRSAAAEVDRRDFDWQNMIGGQCAMQDRILEAFSRDADLSVVFPAEPCLLGWDDSRPISEMLLARLGFDRATPDAFDFPSGATFWIRTALLRILLPLYTDSAPVNSDSLELDEAVLQAAFMRVIPLVARAAGLSQAVTHVPGVTL